jgi:septal ring factor EnvC (AmiA/AmiB activator)
MASDPVKLQAQLVKLQSQLDDVVRERDATQRELGRLKEQNKRGDAELRKAEGVRLGVKARLDRHVVVLIYWQGVCMIPPGVVLW